MLFTFLTRFCFIYSGFHPYIGAAEAIYIALLTYFDQCDIYDINLASELVVSVEWDKDDKPYLLENKMKIAEIFGFSELAVGSNKSDKKVKSKADELDSYESLVREAGKVFKLKLYIHNTVFNNNSYPFSGY